MWRPPTSPALRHLRHLLPSSSPLRPLSSLPSNLPDDLAAKISNDLTTFSSSPSSLSQHLSLHFSNLHFTPSHLLQILNISPSAAPAALQFFHWLVLHRNFPPDDTSLSHLINYLGRLKQFRSIHHLLLKYPLALGPNSLSAALDRLTRARRPAQAVHLFDSVERDHGLKPDLSALSALVSSLCCHGFTGHAEREVKRLADKIFPDENICYTLIRGYCDELKLEDARRLMGEIIRGGFDLGTPAYNSIIDCVCRICRKKDPLRMLPEANRLLVEMELAGIPRNEETFHVLIYNLCKIRKTEDSMKLFREMGQWGCSPGAETYIVLIRSLYQAARCSEGDEMIGFMRSAGFGKLLDRKAYYGFIKILCGIERVEHAMKVFRMMKGYGHSPGVKTYGLLIEKFSTHNQVDSADRLFKEAVYRGVPVVSKEYKVDVRYVKVKKKKEAKKRETMPEKMKRKRKRLKRLRMSFVKKPKSARRFV